MEMKKIGRQMSLLMGVTLSFCLTLFNMLRSGQFTVPGFLISFLVATVISLVIGFLVPMKKVGDAAVEKLGLQPRTLKARLIETLISDLIYTPIITVVMIFMARSHMDTKPPLAPMLIGSLVISLLVGFVLIFFLMPLYLKLVMKKNGIDPDRMGPPQ